MNSKKLKYNPKSIDSIVKYANQLRDKTFLDIILENSDNPEEDIETYSNKSRKGVLGNLLEEVYFGYKINSNPDADFSEVGVELKTTPYEKNKNGELRAGERLVITMLNYDGPIEDEFYLSHVWRKMHLILLVYYFRNKALQNKLQYKIDYVRMFTPPAEDLEIIKQDYDYIVAMIKAGLAHKLSEADTMYLGACTKGSTAEKSVVPQYYGERLPAKKRAFCLKTSYMTYVLNHYIAGEDEDNTILKDSTSLGKQSFDEIIYSIVGKYVGKTDKELCEIFNRAYNNNKAQWNDLACKILGIRDFNAAEFEKANIIVKTIRIGENGTIRESMSFKTFKFMELAEEDFDTSTLHDYFDETRFCFFIWEEAQNAYRIKG